MHSMKKLPEGLRDGTKLIRFIAKRHLVREGRPRDHVEFAQAH
jgi:hypothetical protein